MLVTRGTIHVHNLGKEALYLRRFCSTLKKNVKAYIVNKTGTLVIRAFVFFDCLLHMCPAYKEKNNKYLVKKA
jgi:hypothetical protein